MVVHKMFRLLVAFVPLTHAVDSVDFPVCDANSPTTFFFVVVVGELTSHTGNSTESMAWVNGTNATNSQHVL